jgi:hypothetical protein
MMISRPTEPKKPTAWLKQLNLKSGREETISSLERQIKEMLAHPDVHVEHATRHLTENKSAKKQVKEWLKPLTDNHLQLLDIIPIGGKCLCHNNAEDAVDIMNNLTFMTDFTFREARGYNVMTCPCGCSAHGEIHSLIYCNEKGTYYDVTEDMFGEEKKWFIEVPELTENYKPNNLAQTRQYDIIVNNEGCRRCNVQNQATHYSGGLHMIKQHYS